MSDFPVVAQEFKDKIRERLQNIFVELVPDGTWNTMVEVEVKETLQPTIKAMVEEKLKAEFQPAVDKWVAENMAGLLNPDLDGVLKEIAPQVAETFMRAQVQAIMENCVKSIEVATTMQNCTNCGTPKMPNSQCGRCGNW